MAAHGLGNNTDLVYEYFVNQVDAMSLADGKFPVRESRARERRMPQ